MKHCTIVTLILLLIGCFSHKLSAHEYSNPGQLLLQVDLVFSGQLLSTETHLNEQGMVYTKAVFYPVQRLHVSSMAIQKNTDSIFLTFAGGCYEDACLSVCGMPKLEAGKDYLLFTKDDGKPYMNPLAGGEYGTLEISRDPVTGKSILRSPSGKTLLAADENGLHFSTKEMPNDQQRNGTTVTPHLDDNHLENFRCQAPFSSDGNSDLARVTQAANQHLENGDPLTVAELMQSLKPFFVETLPEIEAGIGRFYSRKNGRIESVELPQFIQADESDPLKKTSDSGISQTSRAMGGPLGACGYQDVPIVMEQHPAGWWSWTGINDAMWHWNQAMPLFQYVPSNGSFGVNGLNEFGGWPGSDVLSGLYGFTWSPGVLAVAFTWRSCDCCEITEADVFFNPSYSWTDDPEYSYNSSSILFLPTTMHELGHVWGYQTGTYNETYDYDHPSAMHALGGVVEDGRGLHAIDAYVIRRHYDNQLSIPSLVDVGVESYFASNGLNDAVLSHSTQYQGSNITVYGMTVENNSTSSLSDVRIQFYLSENNTISSSDYPLGSYYYWSSFPKETYSSADYDLNIPSSVPIGEYYVGAVVTYNGVNYDSHTHNNQTRLKGKLDVKAGSVGVDDFELDLTASLFPNPFHDKLYINLEDFSSAKEYSLVIRNAQGKLVKQVQAAGKLELDVSDLPVGFYVVVLSESGKLVGTKKLVKTQ